MPAANRQAVCAEILLEEQEFAGLFSPPDAPAGYALVAAMRLPD